MKKLDLSQRSTRWLMSLLSGILMVIAFPQTGSLFPLTFVSFVPLLFIEHYFSPTRSKFKLFLHAYFVFFIYNFGTTWWIVYASLGGVLMALFANSLLMALAFLFFHILKKKLRAQLHFLTFASVWLTFEYIHFHWELSWPWLTYGNVFATAPSLVQWYSITGVFGGTLWVLGLNYLIFQLFLQQKASKLKSWLPAATALVIPVVISLTLLAVKDTNGKEYTVTVLQPNLDPYNEKFEKPNAEQLTDLLALADAKKTAKTQLIVAPETALYPAGAMSFSEILDINQLSQHPGTKAIQEYQKITPVPVLIGGSTTGFFNEKNSAASEFNADIGQYIESYNSSLLFDLHKAPKVVHKSKLVLGVERIPFITLFPFLNDLAIDLGGGTGTLGIAKHPTAMKAGKVTFSPVVCYESIYGEFVAQQTIQNSSFIAVITNDGWWDNTPGYKQHFLFAGLRAIENDRWVVRSANTGTSGIIDNTGKVIKRTKWWTKTGFTETIHLRHTTTIYMQIGDLLAKIAGGFTCLLLILIIGQRYSKGRKVTA